MTAAELCMTAVTSAPTKTPINRFEVSIPSIFLSESPAARSSPLPIMSKLKSNKLIPPKMPKINCCTKAPPFRLLGFCSFHVKFSTSERRNPLFLWYSLRSFTKSIERKTVECNIWSYKGGRLSCPVAMLIIEYARLVRSE
ncbi:hypothetical protein SDC9_110295 [bioreactor metagenome]|uniref:Uncharacterized protein n=1 Tax=bioreactor metagenome TaxID=1076179 RepID=A0A645BD83_9ZZZZ